MTTYYVGPGGNDGNNGQSWANRKETLNGAEDIPVAADDIVYVGPGVYRETLTVDVSGAVGQPIIYIADVTGENTDSIGGEVRITGSDNDQTTTRDDGISATTKDYRTFRGFRIDLVAAKAIECSNCDDWIIEDCKITDSEAEGIWITSTSTNFTIRRCFITNCESNPIDIGAGAVHDDAGHTIENCLLVNTRNYNFQDNRVGGITIKNCTFIGSGIVIGVALNAGQQIDVNNCIFAFGNNGMTATAIGEIVENYNTLFGNNTDRTNTNSGANSETYPPLPILPLLLDGFKFDWHYGDLSEWSQVKAIAGTGEATDDLYGFTRPTTSAKKSWGATQFVDRELESTTVQAGSYGRVLNDAGVTFVRRVPIANESTTITLYVRRETNYAGSVPRMIIRQPDQTDRTTDMTAAVDTWEQLSDTFTPAANPNFVDVLVESRNTAVAGDYAVFYDTMEVN